MYVTIKIDGLGGPSAFFPDLIIIIVGLEFVSNYARAAADSRTVGCFTLYIFHQNIDNDCTGKLPIVNQVDEF